MTQFSTLEEALLLHETLIERFGGTQGVRDVGLLESALYRPQTGYYESLVQMAAALMESLLINHAFVDGNKRTAFFLSDIFLRLNGWKITVQPQVGYQFLLRILAKQGGRFESICRWLQTHIEQLNR